MSRDYFVRRAVGCCAVLLLAVFPLCLSAGTSPTYIQINLASDVPGLAMHTDPNLKNPWGVSFSSTSPFWVSNQASDNATLYDGLGNPQSLVVSMPPSIGPTGQAFNGTTDFNLPDGSAAKFLFDTLDGLILGWNSGEGTTAVTVATVSGAVFTGLAIDSVGSINYLYAADVTGHVDVFDTNFNNVTNTLFKGKFTDPNGLPGFNPFNIVNINNNLYVTYAKVNMQGMGEPGGFVDEYDSSGNLLQRIATSGSLFAPWGIALAPPSFSGYGGKLLIGQFGNGVILVYDAVTLAFLGTINGQDGNPIVNPYLWALEFRTGGKNCLTNALYFTAGYNDQKDGLFGLIVGVPNAAGGPNVSGPKPLKTTSPGAARTDRSEE